MTGTPKRMLRTLWSALPLAMRSRILGFARSHRAATPSTEAGSTEPEKFRAGTPSLQGFLNNLKENGFSPTAIIDIGANVGEWSRAASSIFPSSRILMFDGDPDNEPSLHN